MDPVVTVAAWVQSYKYYFIEFFHIAAESAIDFTSHWTSFGHHAVTRFSFIEGVFVFKQRNICQLFVKHTMFFI